MPKANKAKPKKESGDQKTETKKTGAKKGKRAKAKPSGEVGPGSEAPLAPATLLPRRVPAQHQRRKPGLESRMDPAPLVIRDGYRGSGKLGGRVALISGGDSGIGRAVAVHFAREGADVAILYLSEHEDARDTVALIEAEGQRALAITGDVGDPRVCKRAVAQTVKKFGRLDVLVCNAAEQHPQDDLLAITPEQLEQTFRTNVFGMVYLTQAALPHLGAGASIIHTTSVTAYRGSAGLIDYASTKGAQVSFTRSLSANLAPRGIRVNAVAPGPIWTPLIPSTFPAEQVADHGVKVPLDRPGQPAEVAPAFVYLACEDSSYVTGQVLHVNGGEIVGG